MHIATASVSQGSHCGPILFNIFCSDIMECIRNTPVQLRAYADDTNFFRFIENEFDRIQLQSVLDKAVHWCEKNKLPLNANKTTFLSFTASPNHKINTYYYIGTERITEVTEQKDLGVIFDARLRFTTQASAVALRAKSMHGAT